MLRVPLETPGIHGGNGEIAVRKCLYIEVLGRLMPAWLVSSSRRYQCLFRRKSSVVFLGDIFPNSVCLKLQPNNANLDKFSGRFNGPYSGGSKHESMAWETEVPGSSPSFARMSPGLLKKAVISTFRLRYG